MQEPENDKKAVPHDAAKAAPYIHGVLDRIRALEHPGWQGKEDDIVAIKASLARYVSDLEHLTYKYEARGAELEKYKGQCADLERLFHLRPDAMRKVGETEVTDLVRRRQEQAELERGLEKARKEADLERSRLAAEAKERLELRLAELEKEYSEKSEKLAEREREFAGRENALAAGETHLREQFEAVRKKTVEEAAASFDHERATMQDVFAKEKSMLETEAAAWRVKAKDALAHLAEAREKSETLEKELLAAMEASSAEAQKRRLAEMERDARLERLREWEKKGADVERRLAELAGREEQCARAASEAKKTADEFKARVFSLQIDLEEKQKKFDAAKAGMRAEIDALVRKYRK